MWVVVEEAEGKGEVKTRLRAGNHPQRRLLGSRVKKWAVREGRQRFLSSE